MEKSFGYYWEIYHRETGEVVQDGFVRGEPAPSDEAFSPKGKLSRAYASRCTELFARDLRDGE